MFTGIVEEVGSIRDVRRGAASARLTVDAPLVSEGVRVGDSIAVNGVCLTAVTVSGSALTFDAVPETIRRTSLRDARAGDPVNLERALAANGRFGGHIVQGHVDGAGTLASVTRDETARILRIAPPPELMRYIAPKGSIALDGISLTTVEVAADTFTISVIPHTWEHTNLRSRRPGDVLNIEVDLLARYLERLVAQPGASGSVSMEHLAQAGFLEGV